MSRHVLGSCRPAVRRRSPPAGRCARAQLSQWSSTPSRTGARRRRGSQRIRNAARSRESRASSRVRRALAAALLRAVRLNAPARPSPSRELPDLGLRLTLCADLGEDGDRALELLHRLLGPVGGVKQIREVVVQRRLAVAVALGGAERQRRARELERALELTARAMSEREVVERGDARALIACR